MEFLEGTTGYEAALTDLFATTFEDAEGPEEGQVIGGLVSDLVSDTPKVDIRVFRAEQDGAIIAAAIFTSLSFPQDPNRVVLLSPMAVATAHQRKGIGQALLRHALHALREGGADVAITYGDPEYYKRVGFQPITEAQAAAPLPLSMPQGWLGQSLTGTDMPKLVGASRCVEALHRKDVW